MKKIIYILSVIILTFYSCDYCVELEGRVLSSVDEIPIHNAQVKHVSLNISTTTDSLGFFHFSHVGGGRRPRAIYNISKEGYKEFEIEFSSTNYGQVYTVKTGEKEYDLGGKNFYPDSTNLQTYLARISFEKYSKGFSKRENNFIVYMDIDDPEVDFEKFIKREWNTDRYIIR